MSYSKPLAIAEFGEGNKAAAQAIKARTSGQALWWNGIARCHFVAAEMIERSDRS